MEKQIKIVVCTGGFDPLHSGHIKYLNAAKQLGDRLIVGINSDEWLSRKKGKAFMPFEERRLIVGSLKNVDATLSFDDSDGSAIKLLEELKANYPYADIIFTNGGDRNATNIPELAVKDITFEFGVGGDDKANSSSWILEEWKNPKTKRPWGWYRVLDDKINYKIKELVVEPNKSLSMQLHKDRAEHWYILKGKCDIVTEYNGNITKVTKQPNEEYTIGQSVWHQCQNNYDEPCHILEVQHGTRCVEEDIERKNAL